MEGNWQLPLSKTHITSSNFVLLEFRSSFLKGTCTQFSQYGKNSFLMGSPPNYRCLVSKNKATNFHVTESTLLKWCPGCYNNLSSCPHCYLKLFTEADMESSSTIPSQPLSQLSAHWSILSYRKVPKKELVLYTGLLQQRPEHHSLGTRWKCRADTEKPQSPELWCEYVACVVI